MVLWLIIALLLLMFLAYRGVPIIVATIFCSIFVLITSRMPIIEGLSGTYMQGMAGFFQKFFLIFLLGAIFGKVMEFTGAAESIARSVINTFGKKYAMVAVVIATAILCYGGVSVFVVLFCIYPLAMSLFQKSDVPRRLFPAALLAGAATFSMTSPFTPSIQNIIPMKYLGTDTTAAALPGTIAALVLAALVIGYLQREVNKARRNNEPFDDGGAEVAVTVEEKKDKDLPNVWLCVIPMIILLAMLNVFKLDVIIALGSGVLLAIILLWKYVPSIKELWEHIQKAAGNATFSIANTCAAVGFGTVVSQTEGFKMAIDAVTGIGGNPLLAAGVATTALAGIAGSASGGLGIAMPIIADHFLPLGVNPEALHRVVVMACGGLDALPHNGFVITLLVFSGLTHRKSYKDCFVVSVLIPLISLVVLIALFYILPGWM